MLKNPLAYSPIEIYLKQKKKWLFFHCRLGVVHRWADSRYLPLYHERVKKYKTKKKIADCCVIQRRKVSTLGCYLVTSSKEKRKITQSRVFLSRCGPRSRFSFFIFFFLPLWLLFIILTHTILVLFFFSTLFGLRSNIIQPRAVRPWLHAHEKWHPQKSHHHVEKKKRSSSSPPLQEYFVWKYFLISFEF